MDLCFVFVFCNGEVVEKVEVVYVGVVGVVVLVY